MSRRPKPTAIRILEGNRGKRPLNNKEPKYRVCIPKPPEILNETGRKEWYRVGRILVKYKVLTEMDKAVFMSYCFSFQILMELCKLIKEKDMAAILQKTPNGMLVESAISTSANKYYRQMLRSAVELGLTPSSRSRIATDYIEPGDNNDLFE